MSNETKEAVRLLVECMDELRMHDEDGSHRTNPDLKRRLCAYFDAHGLSDPVAMAIALCEPAKIGDNTA